MKLNSSGLDEINDMISNILKGAGGIASRALYVGAGVIADAITNEARNIATEPFEYGTPNHKRLPSPEEKTALQNATAITKFEKNGLQVSTKVVIAGGYADVNGKRKPVPLIAYSVNHGTSFMTKQPFFRKAVRKAESAATAAMKASVEQSIKKETR